MSDCDPMNLSMPGLPVHQQLPEFTQTHVHRVGDAIQPSHPLLPLHLPPSIFPSIRGFSNELALCQRIGASASASVLPVNIQAWFPLGLSGLISLQSRGLSTVFSNITVQKHQFFGAQPSFWSSSHICTVKVKVAQLWLTLCDPKTLQSIEFSRPEYWSG